MRRFALVADLGGTKIAVARIDDSGRITHQLAIPTPRVGGPSVVQAIITALLQLPQQGACVVGVDVPGLAYRNGVVWTPNILGWEKMPLASMLARRFKLPVLIESDRNAFVIGETWKGSAKACSDVVFLVIGTGIGAGIISGGRLLRGHAELAGCLGWMAVRDRFLSPYRFHGCLESHVAGPAIARIAGQTLKRAISTREVMSLARRGNRNARKVLHEAGHFLGLALANLVDTLNPEMIVIGGGVAAAGNLLLAPAEQTMKKWAQPIAASQVRITRSRLGGKAGLLGAARLAFDYIDDLKHS
ncbi:MAG: ROK family protein [Candidatus Sulfotelmatobacter sp.]